MRDMTEGDLHSVYDKGACPNCGGNSIANGPRGGMMINVKCTACQMELNISQHGALRVGQVLSEPEGYVPPASRKLHHQIADGPLAGAWRPNTGVAYGKDAQVAEARSIRASGGVVLPPDPLARPAIQARFGLLGKLFGLRS